MTLKRFLLPTKLTPPSIRDRTLCWRRPGRAGWLPPVVLAVELANPSFFKLRNKGSKTFQFSKYPLNFEFGVMNVATSPAMNNTLAGSTVGNIIKVHVKNPWQPATRHRRLRQQLRASSGSKHLYLIRNLL